MSTAQNRPLVLAYNQVACSGDDAAFQVGQYRFHRAEDGKVNLAFEVLIAGTSALDLQAKEAAFDAIRGEDGPLVVQLGRELEIDLLVADGTTTVTRAAGGFLAGHVGLWLSIRGIGTRRIVTLNSATSVVLSASVTTGTYRAFLPAKLFSGSHAAFTFVGGRCATEKLQNRGENTEFSRLMSVTVTGQAPAKAALRSLTVSIRWDASRRRTATLRGSFAPYDLGSGMVSAKSVHDYFIGTLVTNHLSAFGGESAYELIAETQSYEAPEDVATFTSAALAKTYAFDRTYQERFVADAVGVIDQKIPVIVTANTTHGKKGNVGKVTAQVQYQAAIDHDVVTASGLAAYYAATIRPLIIAAIKLHGATSRVVIESEVPTIDQSANAISASWTCWLPSRSSTLLTYSRTIADSSDDGHTLTKLWNGDDFCFEDAPIGATKGRTIVIHATSQSPIRFTPDGELELLDGGADAGVGVSFHGGGGDEGTAGSSSVLGTASAGGAGAASFGEAGAAAAGGDAGPPAWKQNGGEEQSHDEVSVGRSAHGSGTSEATIYTASATRRYVWAKPTAPIVPSFAGLTAPTPTLTGGSGE